MGEKIVLISDMSVLLNNGAVFCLVNYVGCSVI